MGLPSWIDEVLTVVVVLVLVYMLTLLARRAWLSMRGGLFDLALRRSDATKWRPGLARYSGEVLEWYLVWHPWPFPTLIFPRENSELGALRDSDLSESRLGYATSKIIELNVTGDRPEQWQFALNEGSAMGLISWLESAPPGHVGYRHFRADL